MLLQARGRSSARAIAAEVEVSIRTVYRDVEQLCAAGIPITVERGARGGFQLLEGWRTRLTGLTPSEARALFLAGLPGPAAELGLGEAMASAELKLLATLPAGWRAEARRAGARFHLDPVPWYRSAARVDHLPAIADAVWNERRLRIRYQSWKRTIARELEPLGLVLKAGDWYLVARAGGEPRTYRVSSILGLAVLDERFTRPVRFDLATFWSASTRRFEAELRGEVAVVSVSRLGLERLRGWSGAVAPALDAATPDPEARGWRRVTLPIESVEHAVPELLRLGAEVEVLEPRALRQRLAETARALAARYG